MSEHAASPSPDGTHDDDNPIMAELRRIRVAQLAAYGNDVNRMIADDRRRQYSLGHDVVARDPKTGRLVVVFKASRQDVEKCER
jgi:hypothetical protein